MLYKYYEKYESKYAFYNTWENRNIHTVLRYIIVISF